MQISSQLLGIKGKVYREFSTLIFHQVIIARRSFQHRSTESSVLRSSVIQDFGSLFNSTDSLSRVSSEATHFRVSAFIIVDTCAVQDFDIFILWVVLGKHSER